MTFKNCAPFTKCITKIDGATIDDAEDIDLVMSMYNLYQYSVNYYHTTGNLWFYSKDEANNFNVDIVNTNNFKFFECKTKLLGNTVAHETNGMLRNTTIAAPSKYLSNF